MSDSAEYSHQSLSTTIVLWFAMLFVALILAAMAAIMIPLLEVSL